MAYCTVQQVRDATGMQNTTKIPDSYITLKIDYGTGLINSAVARRYVLPITHDMLSFLNLEIAVALLFMDQYGENSEDTDKGWERRLKFLTGEIEKIANGEVQLRDPSTGAEMPRTTLGQPSFHPSLASSDPAATDSTQPKFTMNKVY